MVDREDDAEMGGDDDVETDDNKGSGAGNDDNASDDDSEYEDLAFFSNRDLRLIPVRGAKKNAPLGVRIHNMNVPIFQFANKEIIRLRTELIAQIRKTAQAEEKAADLEDELERTKKMAAAHAAEPSTSDLDL